MSPKAKRNVIIASFIFFSCCTCSFFGSLSDEDTQNNKSEVKGVSEETNIIEEQTPVEVIAPSCVKEEEVSRSCTECNKAVVIYYNEDCTTYELIVDDSSCTSLCPKVEPPSPVYIAPTPIFTPPSAPAYVCNCNKTCPQMASCDEAYFQLNNCGCNKRDNDNDGIPCEDICY